METGIRLDDYLQTAGALDARYRDAVARTVGAIASAGCAVADLLAAGPLDPELAAQRGEGHGDVQKELDLRANALMIEALRGSPVAFVASEELDTAETLDPKAPLAVAIDPLDGSSNIDTAVPVGTIFSVLPAEGRDADAAFLCAGTDQLAAGFLIYGSLTALVLTLGSGTMVFAYDRARGTFVAPAGPARIAAQASEYAINGSNHRHWSAPVRRFIDEFQQGAEGPRGRNFNTRWLASLVGEAYRILVRGGIYLYPGDARQGYREGRLRLVYEASPLAWIIEQAGGAATDGQRRILDLVPRALHQRIPLVFGAADDVSLLVRYHATSSLHDPEPLFASRSLFRPQAGHHEAHA